MPHDSAAGAHDRSESEISVNGDMSNDAAVWSRVEQLTCELSVHVPVLRFGVRDLLSLSAGTVVSAHWEQSKNVPLDVNGREVAWCEFEVMQELLAVRITELR